jgi:hypothetical protein
MFHEPLQLNAAHLDRGIVEAGVGVSLKQAPSARSALRSAETRAEIVCPVRLVDSQVPFSLATTPGGTE